MRPFCRFGAGLAISALLVLPVAAQDSLRVLHVSAMGSGEGVEVEIQTSGTLTPQSQIIQAPDRIVVDFPGALPAASLRAVAVNRGPLKAIRTGLFSAKPPITRVVLDLVGPRSYQIFASRNSVMVKLAPAGANLVNTAAASAPLAVRPAVLSTTAAAVAPAPPEAAPAAPPKPSLDVSFQDGLLRIRTEKATLAEVLFAVHQQTGAEIAIPAGAEQEQVAVDLGPAPARDVLALMLNGSRYNYVFIGKDDGSSLQQVILTRRNPGDDF
jgi:hypothetical protein